MEGAYGDERLWIDKYQPKRVEELDFNHNITNIMKTIAQKEDFPHLIFYGPEGAGKKTRIRALLALLYGPGVHKVNSELKEIKVNSTTVEYLITSSNFHIELTPSDAEHHDRIIVQRVIKETASVETIDKKTKGFKIIVLQDIDNLTKEAQAALRRTMEKYMTNCRLIMSCNSLTKIIPPIRSRCLSIRVPCPTEKDIRNILTNIRIREDINNVNDNQIDKIIQSCERNVRRAINCLQLSKNYIKYNLIAMLETYKNDIFIPEYIGAIKAICGEIMQEQSAVKLKNLREPFLKLLVNGVPSETIIINMVKEFCSRIKNDEVRRQIIYWSSFYDNR